VPSLDPRSLQLVPVLRLRVAIPPKPPVRLLHVFEEAHATYLAAHTRHPDSRSLVQDVRLADAWTLRRRAAYWLE